MGAIAKADVDKAARRIFRTMMKLGMLDPMEDQPYVGSRHGADQIDNARSRQVALRAATEGESCGHAKFKLRTRDVRRSLRVGITLPEATA